MVTRGIRNNNPANIRRGSSWLGLRSVQTDKSFCQFDTMAFGIRAFFVLMRTYHYKYKLNTISQILHRFAPLCENSTNAYISRVCQLMNNRLGYEFNISPDTVVNCWYNRTSPKMLLQVFSYAVFSVESFADLSEQIPDAVKLI